MAEELNELVDNVVNAEDTEEYGKVINQLVAANDPEEIALLLESLPVVQRLSAWEHVRQPARLAILLAMRHDARETIIREASTQELDEIFQGIEAEDLVELAETLPNRMVDRALAVMDAKQRDLFKDALQYSDDCAGHWANYRLLVLPVNAKVRDALRLLRREIPDHADTIFLVNRMGYFTSAVEISAVIGSPEHINLIELADEDCVAIDGNEKVLDAALKVEKSNFSALPMVDAQGKLIGRMDLRTACEVIREHYEGQLMASAGMDEEEDLFSPVIKSARNRAVWLGINLLTAFAASWFIGLFEATIQEVVALAVLMPVVASMGGIAGSQTLTLMIRGLALGQVTSSNTKALFRKEVSVGGLNGVIWAIVIGIVTYHWFDSMLIGLVIGIAILVNILAAAMSGIAVPLALKKLRLDPALSGSVVLTTVTDIVGFVAFLGLGSLILV
ncbi:magnesium transporter [Saccharophagus degradans]|uniref:Magnesium transporter n=1 Tax=Saccharophagus degradans TaxID=86304 RepID=A0AAW7X6S9_9GAMM|nr:magnesium transporter [Saccharophagus degradans]MDO6422572.1 magnesium transporter [Saccharophagus degradans]MDO6609120.1 magnesium transporter [Saccharophagus degradans]